MKCFSFLILLLQALLASAALRGSQLRLVASQRKESTTCTLDPSVRFTDECDGLCIAPIFDQIQAAPFVGNLIAGATTASCSASDVIASGTTAHAQCKQPPTNVETFGNLCDFFMTIFGLEEDACAKFSDCFKDGSLTACHNAFTPDAEQIAENYEAMYHNLEQFGDEVLNPDFHCPFTENIFTETAAAVDAVAGILDDMSRFEELVESNIQTILEAKEWTEAWLDSVADCEHSMLLGLTFSSTIGPFSLGKSAGIYVTFVPSELYGSSLTHDQIFDALWGAEVGSGITEAGLYVATSAGVTTDAGLAGGVGVEVQLVQGAKDVWGGSGYTLSIGIDADAIIAQAGFDLGFVFSAGENGPEKLIGVSLGLGISAGPTNPSPVSVSWACGYADAVASATAGADGSFDVSTCGTAPGDDEVVEPGVDWDQRLQDALQCRAAANCIWDECQPQWVDNLSNCVEHPVSDVCLRHEEICEDVCDEVCPPCTWWRWPCLCDNVCTPSCHAGACIEYALDTTQCVLYEQVKSFPGIGGCFEAILYPEEKCAVSDVSSVPLSDDTAAARDAASCETGWTHTANKALRGNSIDTLHRSDFSGDAAYLDACKAACDSNSNCMGFVDNYQNAATRRCVLKSSINTYTKASKDFYLALRC